MLDRGSVFVVAEAESDAESIRNLLTKSAYSVELKNGSPDTLDAIAVAGPDLVMLDANLPDIDPFKFCEQLKQHKHTSDIPVIFIVPADDAEARVMGVEFGDDIVTQPFEDREVLARVERQVTVSKVRVALRESEAKFRSVMESAIDAIISGDVAGNIRSWNSAAAALFQYSEEEAIGQPIELIIPERFRDQHARGMRRVSEGGPSKVIGKTVELAALRKDGSEFPVELSLATWFLDDVRYFTGIIRDISERKQAEQKFRSVTESAIDAIISADHTGKIVSWNNAATRILGYNSEETIGQQLELIIPQRFHRPHQDGMKRVTERGESRVIGQTVELSACTKGGEEIPIELSLSTWTVRDERYYTGIIRDIRERKKAEESLRLSEQALRESSVKLQNKNKELEGTLNQLHEMQNQLIMQEKMASLGKLSAGMAHELNNPASAAQRSANQLQKEFRKLRDACGLINNLELTDSQLETLDELGKIADRGGSRFEELSPLERSDQESAVEHWLRERGVEDALGLAPSLVNLGYDGDKLHELAGRFTAPQFVVVVDWLTHVHTINSLLSEITLGTGRITEIVRALKTYTYMDRAPVQMVDIHEGLDNTLIILQNKLKKGVTVHREYDETTPVIQAYGSELNQVWTNLIDNAIDAMDGKGRLTIRTREKDCFVEVDIEDNGPGIPAELLTKIFDPFFTTKPPGEGSGLGLNISRNIVVQMHGGHIAASSEPGKTTFHVVLPIEHSTEPSAPVE